MYRNYLRLARARYLRVSEDYYDSWQGLWDAPDMGSQFRPDHIYILRMPDPNREQWRQALLEQYQRRKAIV